MYSTHFDRVDSVMIVSCLLLAAGAFLAGEVCLTGLFLVWANLFLLLTWWRGYADWYYADGPGKPTDPADPA